MVRCNCLNDRIFIFGRISGVSQGLTNFWSVYLSILCTFSWGVYTPPPNFLYFRAGTADRFCPDRDTVGSRGRRSNPRHGRPARCPINRAVTGRYWEYPVEIELGTKDRCGPVPPGGPGAGPRGPGWDMAATRWGPCHGRADTGATGRDVAGLDRGHGAIMAGSCRIIFSQEHTQYFFRSFLVSRKFPACRDLSIL